jgi:hypothetical protein
MEDPLMVGSEFLWPGRFRKPLKATGGSGPGWPATPQKKKHWCIFLYRINDVLANARPISAPLKTLIKS